MIRADFAPLLPYIILGYGATLLLVIGAFWRRHVALAALTLAVFVGALTATVVSPSAARQVTPLLHLDALARFYLALFCGGGALLVVFSRDYLAGTAGRERYYALLLYAVLGMAVLAASAHFASFFLGMQLLSVSLYGLIGFTLRRTASLEASLKYIVLGGAALSFLLLGIALLYSEYGTMEFGALALRFGASTAPLPTLALLGLGLILVAFVFKLALAPAHVWAPDVYQGAPAPITALLATGSKAAMFALLVRFVSLVATHERGSLLVLVEVLAIATMTVGNLLALLQRNLKRLLAYSSVAHMGYLLIALAAGGPAGLSALSFYFISYFITTIGAFGLIAALSREGEEFERLEDYRGLAARRPWLAAALGLMMLSLAGIPPTIGFMAKFYLFAAAAESRLWLLLIVGVINSGISVYYYLQVLAAMYLRPAEPEVRWPRVRLASAAALVALTLALLFLGLFPGPLIAGTRRMADTWFAQYGSRPAVAQPLAYPSPAGTVPPGR